MKSAMESRLEPGTVGELIVSALQRHADRVAFLDGPHRLTYRELGVRVARLVALFAELGLRPGDTVVQLSGNRPETFATVAAIYVAGLRSVTLHAMASEDDHAYILADSEAQAVIVDPAYQPRGEALRRRCGDVPHWLSHGAIDGMDDAWAMAAELAPQPLRPVGGAEDVIRLAYTGGTTGKPKGVMLSNRAIATNTVLALAGIDWPDKVLYLCPAPISHGAGSLVIPTLMRGGTVMLQHGFDPARFLDAVEQHRCTVTWLVPTMIYALLDHPRTRSVDWRCMHTMVYSAAPMAPARIREALDVFGPCMVQSFGQTESPNTILTLSRADHAAADDARLASAGKPFPMLRVALLDDACREVPDGQVGEICVRGPLLMSGYWKQPEQTAAAFDGGWLHTGDLAWRDADGYFYIVDRKKDMIISGGFNVYPKEVEDVLSRHPEVAAAAVIGVPDDKWGEAVKAVVRLKAGRHVEAAELIALVREAKGTVCAPKSVDFVDALPLTALGKIDKKALRARYWGDAVRSVN